MLTTHRMDEAEALCDVIAIVVNGQIVCINTPHVLKTRHGKGYFINIKNKSSRNQLPSQGKFNFIIF